jgi:hypothetical protein
VYNKDLQIESAEMRKTTLFGHLVSSLTEKKVKWKDFPIALQETLFQFVEKFGEQFEPTTWSVLLNK